MTAAGDAARGSRQHRAGGEPRRLLDRHHAAMGLHDQDGARIPGLLQPLAEPLKIARQPRAHIGVHHRGGEALKFLDLGQHLRRQRHIGIRQCAAYRLGCDLLVTRIAPGVEKTDRDRLDVRGTKAAIAWSRDVSSSGTSTRPSWRMRSMTGRRKASRHQLRRRRHTQVVAFDRLEALAHLDTSRWPAVTSMPVRAPLPSSSALVATVVPCTIRFAARNSSAVGIASVSASRASPSSTPRDWIVWCRGYLGERRHAVIVDGDQVGECAADVDADTHVRSRNQKQNHSRHRPLAPPRCVPPDRPSLLRRPTRFRSGRPDAPRCRSPWYGSRAAHGRRSAERNDVVRRRSRPKSRRRHGGAVTGRVGERRLLGLDHESEQPARSATKPSISAKSGRNS